MNAPRLELIAAVARNGVIGRDGKLPWHLPDDLRHFKELTMGHAILMGRRTFESIGRALPGRTSIVVSRSLSAAPAGVKLAHSLDDAMLIAAATPPAFIIGGAMLYAAALPRADVLHLTELDEDVPGDTYFPAWNRAEWRLTSTVDHSRDDRHAIPFRICRYERIA